MAVGEKFKNLNVQIAKEAAAPPSLDKTFANDIVDIDADGAGHTFLIVSRGGNQLFRAHLVDPATGQLNILNTAGDKVACRLQTGNLPSGVAMSEDGSRAYANNEANFSVTSVNIDDCSAPTRHRLQHPRPPAASSTPSWSARSPSSLGIPDNNFGNGHPRHHPAEFPQAITRRLEQLRSCHPDGLADGVTWIFGTGPRQTKPLDGMFNKFTNMEDQGLLNWSAIRGSNTDFNNNSRATQGLRLRQCGGDRGWIGPCNQDPATPPNLTPNPAIYDHGITQGAVTPSTCRPCGSLPPCGLHQPQPSDAAAGARARRLCGQLRLLPRRSQMDEEPDLPPRQPRRHHAERADLGPRRHQARAGAAGGRRATNEFFSFTCNALTINYLEDVGTFDDTEPLEIRDNAAASLAFGRNGFNVPSLLSINYHAPYLHRGQAQTLEVFPLHGLGPQGSGFPPTTTIATELTALSRRISWYS